LETLHLLIINFQMSLRTGTYLQVSDEIIKPHRFFSLCPCVSTCVCLWQFQ